MFRRLSPLFAAVFAAGALASTQLNPTTARAAPGAPGFALEDCHGKPVTLDQYAGSPLVLNFWATWCGPCQLEIPALSSYARSNPEVAVVGVAVDSGPSEHMPQLRTQLDIDYEIYAADNAIIRAYGVRGLPTTVVIGSDGAVSATHTGPITEAELARLVQRAR